MGRNPIVRKRWCASLLAAATLTIAAPLLAQPGSYPSSSLQTSPPQAYTGPELPQDRGAVALWQDLQKLGTTTRILQVTAHPDDEDGGMLTLEARGHGATVMLFSFTRGDGGQNKFGTETAEDLGILRTL